MSLLKYIDRLERMDQLIRRKATGNAMNFASMLGISVSVLKETLNEMRALGADIEYCRVRKSYIYKRSGRLLLRFESHEMSDEDTLEIKGGASSFWTLYRTVFPDDNKLGLLLQANVISPGVCRGFRKANE